MFILVISFPVDDVKNFEINLRILIKPVLLQGQKSQDINFKSKIDQ